MPQKLFLPLLIVAGLVVTSLVSANWTPPTGLTPPDCPAGYPGCDAPINVSIVDQFKLGSLGVNKFFQSLGKLFVSNNLASTSPDSFRLVGASYDPNYVLMAQGNIGAEKYCDVNGENCKTITELGTASSTPGGGGGVYVGATAVTYNGAEVGGYSGGDAKCNTAFPGSRMATAADFANGRPTVSGWYSGLIYDAYSPYPNNDCVGWADSTAGYFGFYWNAGTPAAAISQCNTKNKILCSMSGTGGGGGGGGTGGVTSLTAGAGITLTPNPITTTGTIAATGGGGSLSCVTRETWVAAGNQSAVVFCDSGYVMTGGGGACGGSASSHPYINAPNGEGWMVACSNYLGQQSLVPITARVICCKIQ